MEQMDNRDRLFYGSCFALITTALSFSIRAGILAQLGQELSFSAEQLGWINGMWFLGFPLSMLVGGLIYNNVGPKRIMQFAFFSHTIGILLTIYSFGSFGVLLFSTFLIGLGNGCTEAACNPMIADSYKGVEMSKKMNRFHMWFPGGIVIGALISKFMTDMGTGWKMQIWIILIPTIIYAILFWGQKFPKPREEAASLANNLKAMVAPLFLYMFVCMTLTAITEFGPNQWVQLILKESGAHPMLIMAVVFGSMTILRYFGGNIVGKFDQTGVLLGSAVLAIVGIFLLTKITGPVVYIAAMIYACGIAYFWPNMLGFIADYIPKSGAIGLSVIGAAGMFSTFIWQPIIGGWIDSAKQTEMTELAAGQATLARMMFYPGILIVLFAVLYVWGIKLRAAKKQQQAA
jgi:MFS family permease